MEYKKRKRNRPISIAIKGYLDKSGGNVSKSRNEIEWRFNALDWRYQKQILFAFLQSGMSDRKWAYKKLYALWDDCFIPQIKDLWESYHEIEVSWLIIRFFPIDYLKQNFDSLSTGRNYYFLYCRLHNDPDFVLDKTRLNEVDLLGAMHDSGEIITDDDIKDLFYMLIYKLCKGTYRFMAHQVIYEEGYPVLAIFRCSMVKTMLKVIAGDLAKYKLHEVFLRWILSISEDFIKDNKNLCDNSYLYDEEYKREKITSYCLNYIDQEYKNIWDSFDINDRKRYLDSFEERHNKRVQNYKTGIKPVSDNNIEVKTMEEVGEIFGNSMISRLVDSFELDLVK